MLNNAVIMGRLTADPELRTTPLGVSVTRFTVAVDRAYVKQGEERKTDFINVIAWRKTGEFICRNFHKGKMIAIVGSIQTGSYEKDGVKHNTFEINADKGKPQCRLVPSEIIRCIAKVREYGLKKYGSSESWRKVEVERYQDAMYRHLLAYIENPTGKDEESGLPHLWHLACNVAFLCEMNKEYFEGGCNDA